MEFKVGDTVVYPHHGAATIQAIEMRTVKGTEKEYLVLKVSQGDLTVKVPAENAEPAPAPEGVCVEQTTATLPSADDLDVGVSVPATVSFSNGDRIETEAAVVGELVEAGEYTRPTEYAGESEEH